MNENAFIRCRFNYIETEAINLGQECNILLISFAGKKAVKTIRSDCLNFYIIALFFRLSVLINKIMQKLQVVSCKAINISYCHIPNTDKSI